MAKSARKLKLRKGHKSKTHKLRGGTSKKNIPIQETGKQANQGTPKSSQDTPKSSPGNSKSPQKYNFDTLMIKINKYKIILDNSVNKVKYLYADSHPHTLHFIAKNVQIWDAPLKNIAKAIGIMPMPASGEHPNEFFTTDQLKKIYLLVGIMYYLAETYFPDIDPKYKFNKDSASTESFWNKLAELTNSTEDPPVKHVIDSLKKDNKYLAVNERGAPWKMIFGPLGNTSVEDVNKKADPAKKPDTVPAKKPEAAAHANTNHAAVKNAVPAKKEAAEKQQAAEKKHEPVENKKLIGDLQKQIETHKSNNEKIMLDLKNQKAEQEQIMYENKKLTKKMSEDLKQEEDKHSAKYKLLEKDYNDLEGNLNKLIQGHQAILKENEELVAELKKLNAEKEQEQKDGWTRILVKKIEKDGTHTYSAKIDAGEHKGDGGPGDERASKAAPPAQEKPKPAAKIDAGEHKGPEHKGASKAAPPKGKTKKDAAKKPPRAKSATATLWKNAAAKNRTARTIRKSQSLSGKKKGPGDKTTSKVARPAARSMSTSPAIKHSVPLDKSLTSWSEVGAMV